ncbi:MAG: heme-binding domain-containing protein [Desulfovibrionaceae bacterium]|nr:heme-binding domain-containing protein [Desulfovibrionaceae bacterium]
MKLKAGLWAVSSALALVAAGAGMGTAAQDLPAGPPSLTKFSKVATLVQEKCMACHSRDYDLPFYARIPGIKEIVEKDYNDGLRAMDLNTELVESTTGQPIGEATLAKMEWVVRNDTMPPAKFTAVHWSSRLSNKDKGEILDWVKTSRADHYSTGTAAPDKANEPLQPLPASLPVNPQKAALGEKLFNDKRLSGDNSVACVTCHGLDKGGTDNQRFSKGIRDQYGDVNAPTVFNAVFHVKQFWNGRAADLQEQAGGPPFNPIEMGSKDWPEIIAKLNQDEALTEEFKAVYPAGWTGNNITDAIAEYEKTLITPNSRFDQWLQGSQDAITPAEVEGYERFKAYRCASCHVGKAVGGQSFEYMNLKKDYFADRGGDPLGSDEGLKGFTNNDIDQYKFKVPNLRNVELTAPYLHDGTVTTLDDAVRVMGTYLSGIDVPKGDRDLIVGFLRTLTGEFQGKKLTGQQIAQQ